MNVGPTASSIDQAAAGNVVHFRAAFQCLPYERRELLALYYLYELSIAEIAEILTIPPGTVKSKLHYDRKELKELFERNEP